VGRWVRLSRRTGWPWAEFATLTRIIDAESDGIPTAVNSSSECAGLLQLAPCWYSGKWQFDPYDPRLNLLYGLRVWRLCGWGAWVTY
jgi:soluble lytic murein transglycosylase-like protein